jgi:hypothetical protein
VDVRLRLSNTIINKVLCRWAWGEIPVKQSATDLLLLADKKSPETIKAACGEERPTDLGEFMINLSGVRSDKVDMEVADGKKGPETASAEARETHEGGLTRADDETSDSSEAYDENLNEDPLPDLVMRHITFSDHVWREEESATTDAGEVDTDDDQFSLQHIPLDDISPEPALG